MVDIWLPYGKTEVCVRVPARTLLGEVRPEFPEGVEKPDFEINRALREPLVGEPLKDSVDGKKKIAIAFYGYIPPPLLNLVVSSLFKELIDAMSREVYLILPQDSEISTRTLDVEALSGQHNNLQINVIRHDITSKDKAYIGKTSSGNKIYLSRTFTEADVRVTISSVGLHPFAGFSGGRMAVLPGVAMEESIQRCYKLLTNSEARPGKLIDNPVHKEMMEAAKMADIAFTLNLVINQRGELLRAFSGDVERAFMTAAELSRKISFSYVKEKANILVVSPGGYPQDSNLFRALNSLIYCAEILKRKGHLILVAECSEGYGNEVFIDWFKNFRDAKSLEKAIKKKYTYGAHQAYYLAKILEKAEVTLVSTLPDYYTNNLLGIKTAKAVNYALNAVLNEVKTKANVLVVPFGNFTLLNPEQ